MRARILARGVLLAAQICIVGVIVGTGCNENPSPIPVANDAAAQADALDAGDATNDSPDHSESAAVCLQQCSTITDCLIGDECSGGACKQKVTPACTTTNCDDVAGPGQATPGLRGCALNSNGKLECLTRCSVDDDCCAYACKKDAAGRFCNECKSGRQCKNKFCVDLPCNKAWCDIVCPSTKCECQSTGCRGKCVKDSDCYLKGFDKVWEKQVVCSLGTCEWKTCAPDSCDDVLSTATRFYTCFKQ